MGRNDRQVALSLTPEKIISGAINSIDAELRGVLAARGGAPRSTCGIDVMSMQAEYVFDWAARILGGVRA